MTCQTESKRCGRCRTQPRAPGLAILTFDAPYVQLLSFSTASQRGSSHRPAPGRVGEQKPRVAVSFHVPIPGHPRMSLEWRWEERATALQAGVNWVPGTLKQLRPPSGLGPPIWL